MKLTFKTNTVLLVLLLITNIFISNPSIAHEYKHKGLLINHPYATPTRPGMNNGVMFIVNIKNSLNLEDEFIGISTSIAKLSEIHSMKTENGMMKMRKLTSIKLPPNKTVSIKKGNANGYHIMLIGLKEKLKHGDNFEAKLHFKNTPSLIVNVEVIKTTNTHKH